ncbi:ComF family protein [Sneathiella glossodoripedis]|uniref:ComF family protein n=1 Tax=Sneathiella glossodoripedis TaxID=418853 RepID=UPI00131F33D8|nr:ComF family protein [Sneathiella glossodoripedis]
MDLLFPSQCPGCREIVDKPGSFCASCWSELTFITDPKCSQCGYPFDYEEEVDMKCASCLTSPPAFDHAVSALKYDDAIRASILAFKHSDRTDLAPSFASWLTRIAKETIDPESVICPVPLHTKRLRQRKYNQAGLLAKTISDQLSLPYIPDLLIRVKNTPSQGTKSAKERVKNVRNAFKVNPAWDSENLPKHVLLVDDVFTTGATLNACATCLKEANVEKVTALTLSRVVRATKIPI